MDDATLLEVLHATASAVADALGDWTTGVWPGPSTGSTATTWRPTKPRWPCWTEAGVGVLSEESGTRGSDRGLVVVVDPVDGSTNASQGVPWYATSLCAVDADGPRAALVVDQASGVRFEAVRGGGARKDGVPVTPSGCDRLEDAIVAFSGYPPRHYGWNQYRCLGAAALDLCAVAEGVLDGYAVVGGSLLGQLGLPGRDAGVQRGRGGGRRGRGKGPRHARPHRPPGAVRSVHPGPARGVPGGRRAVASGPSGA